MPEMVAYCGLTCQTCLIYLAARGRGMMMNGQESEAERSSNSAGNTTRYSMRSKTLLTATAAGRKAADYFHQA